MTPNLSLKTKISIGLTVLFLVLFAGLHLYLVSNTFYMDPAGSIHSTREGYGDIPLHLTQISKFAFSQNFDLSEPVYYGNKLQYPFAVNLASGLLLKLTGQWPLSVLWPMYFLVLANIVLVFLIYKKLLSRNTLAIGAFLLFFLGGGLGGWPYLSHVITGQESLGNAVSNIAQGNAPTINKFDAQYPSQNIAFGDPLSLAFIHQRTAIIGLFGFLLFLWLLLKAWDDNKKRYLIGAGLTFGLLPLIHTHSFVAAAGVLFIMLVFNLRKSRRATLKKLLVIALIGTIFAVPQLYFLLSGKSTLGSQTAFAQFRLGWMVNAGIGAVQFPAGPSSSSSLLAFGNFLWLNFGIILPLFLLSLILLPMIRKSEEEEKKNFLLSVFSLGALLLFLAVQLIKFQPWDYDNNKILIYFLFLAAPLIIWMPDRIFQKWPVVKNLVIWTVIVFSIFSGVMDLVPRIAISRDNLPVIFTADAQKTADYIRTKIPEQNLILTGTTHLNPVDSLAGRPVLEGYPGWLWTRGIDYGAREREIGQFYQSPNFSSRLLREWPISYILVDNSVISDFHASPAVFDQLFPRVFTAGQYILYKVI